MLKIFDFWIRLSECLSTNFRYRCTSNSTVGQNDFTFVEEPSVTGLKSVPSSLYSILKVLTKTGLIVIPETVTTCLKVVVNIGRRSVTVPLQPERFGLAFSGLYVMVLVPLPTDRVLEAVMLFTMALTEISGWLQAMDQME